MHKIEAVSNLIDEIEDKVLNSEPDNKELQRINDKTDEVIAQLDVKKYFKRLP